MSLLLIKKNVIPVAFFEKSFKNNFLKMQVLET